MAKASPKKAAGPAELIISKSRTKDAVTDFNISGDFYEALDRKVRELIRGAEQRAKGNDRKTLRPYDL